MKRSTLAVALLAGVALAAPGGTAQATTYTIAGSGATFLINADGTLSVQGGGPTEYNTIVQGNQTISAFSFSPAFSGSVFQLGNIGGALTQSLAFNGPLAGGTDTLSYNIAESGGAAFTYSASDLVQSAGQSTLTETLNALAIAFVQNGSNVSSGNTSVTFSPPVTSINVKDVLTIGANGSNVSGIDNSFAVPEPSGVLPFGAGLLGLAFARGRKPRRGGAATAA